MLFELLVALYLLLGLALMAFMLLWLLAYRLGVVAVVTGKGSSVLTSAYRRRLALLAKGTPRQLMRLTCWLLVYALLAWPWLFVALFCEKKQRFQN